MMPLLALSAARGNAIYIPLSINSNRMAAGKSFNSHCQHKKQRKHGSEEDQPRGQQKNSVRMQIKGPAQALSFTWAVGSSNLEQLLPSEDRAVCQATPQCNDFGTTYKFSCSLSCDPITVWGKVIFSSCRKPLAWLCWWTYSKPDRCMILGLYSCPKLLLHYLWEVSVD